MEMITLNLIPKGISPVCHASQYDKGRVIRCNLVDGLQGYVLSGETAVLNVIKPDNNIVTEALTATTGNNYIDIITTEQMCAVAGKNECEIRLTKGEVEVGTLNFIMQVEADVTTGGIESETVIHDLKTTISDMVKEEIEAISPEEELSGAMASFETHEIAPLVDCKVKIEAIQSGSGTPSPDNVRPITGFSSVNVSRTGKNLLPMPITSGSYSNQVTITVNDDKSFYVTKTSGSGWTNLVLCSDMLLKAGTYRIIEDDDSSQDAALNIYQAGTQTVIENTRYLKSKTFVLENDTRVDINYSRAGIADNVLTKVMLFNGDTTTASDYEPYNGMPVTISLGQTVYGGSLDVTSGVLTVTRGYKTVTSNDTVRLFGSLNSNTVRAGIVTSDMKAPTWNNTSEELDIFCNIATPNTDALHASANAVEGQCCLYKDGSYPLAVFTFPSSCSTANLALTELVNNGCEYCYPLATPVTYQLTPTEIKTILGVNNIWADTGDIDVVYHHELTARYVYFDNTGTDLTATNVEAAIKELLSRLQ